MELCAQLVARIEEGLDSADLGEGGLVEDVRTPADHSPARSLGALLCGGLRCRREEMDRRRDLSCEAMTDERGEGLAFEVTELGRGLDLDRSVREVSQAMEGRRRHRRTLDLDHQPLLAVKLNLVAEQTQIEREPGLGAQAQGPATAEITTPEEGLVWMLPQIGQELAEDQRDL